VFLGFWERFGFGEVYRGVYKVVGRYFGREVAMSFAVVFSLRKFLAAIEIFSFFGRESWLD
jgi:hypothetical protein